MKNSNNLIEQIKQHQKEISDFQNIITESQQLIRTNNEQISLLIKHLEEQESKEQKIKQRTFSPKEILNQNKSFYLYGKEIMRETNKDIEIDLSSESKTKTSQSNLNRLGRLYGMKYNLEGKKDSLKEQVEWASNIEYKGEVIPFKKDKIVLSKAQ